MLQAIAVLLAVFLTSSPELETKVVQVSPAPAPSLGFTRSQGQPRAVLLLHGFRPLLEKGSKASAAGFRDWQNPDSILVRALAKEADVFAFAYSQNVPLETVGESPGLADAIERLQKLGYSEIVLVGHSAGGVISRLFVEDHPEAGVTKVVQVCSPNRGSTFAKTSAGIVKGQKAFLASLTPEARSASSEKRSAKKIPQKVQFVCIVGGVKGTGDGLVPCVSQWPEDLQRQGIPCLRLATTHFTVMRSARTSTEIAGAVRRDSPRWDAAQVAAMKKTFEKQ